MSAHADAVEAIESVAEEEGEADDVLRRVVAILHERLGRFVRISFVEDDELVPGPAAGEDADTESFPIAFQGRRVAELEVAGELTPDDRACLEQIATLVAPFALVGWDTGGEVWTP